MHAEWFKYCNCYLKNYQLPGTGPPRRKNILSQPMDSKYGKMIYCFAGCLGNKSYCQGQKKDFIAMPTSNWLTFIALPTSHCLILFYWPASIPLASLATNVTLARKRFVHAACRWLAQQPVLLAWPEKDDYMSASQRPDKQQMLSPWLE
jgi:hypothetical protein